MGKSKEISLDLRKKMVDLHKSGMSLGAISEQLQIPRSSVQTVVHKYKLLGGVATLPRSGRRPKLSPSAEMKLVRMVRNNPGTTKTQACHELEAAGTPVSLSTVKRVLHRHGLNGKQASPGTRGRASARSGFHQGLLRPHEEDEDADVSPGDIKQEQEELPLSAVAVDLA
ncbi:hypothetical protein DPEC_G00122740 [Dallia pectoralis]|uniref:Uncharacterized protein n=1 Tax=Dallia pectoralis TaxID=75939 RepID=A0ACC2GQG9_DALPE|nr:hypothetical protein DPEC_G00122740 [Dallia pectoralis]